MGDTRPGVLEDVFNEAEKTGQIRSFSGGYCIFFAPRAKLIEMARGVLSDSDMVFATKLHATDDDLAPRRPATVEAVDARLSVWGQASRHAIGRRADALSAAAGVFAERHGREAAVLSSMPVDGVEAVLGNDSSTLGMLAATVLPEAVRSSCRILWVDPSRLTENLMVALGPHLEAARAEIRRIQALHRRRARLWRHDVERLNQLREDVEALTVPRGGQKVIDGVVETLEKLRRA